MADSDGGTWVSISEAARRLRITRAAVRGRVRRGTLDQRMERQGNRERPMVRLPERYREPPQVPSQVRAMVPDASSHGAPAAELVAELATLRERVAGLERERDTLHATWELERAELRERIEGLGRRLDEAQTERRLLQEAHEAEVDRLLTVVETLAAEPATPTRRPWPGLKLWLRRLWEGEG